MERNYLVEYQVFSHSLWSFNPEEWDFTMRGFRQHLLSLGYAPEEMLQKAAQAIDDPYGQRLLALVCASMGLTIEDCLRAISSTAIILGLGRYIRALENNPDISFLRAIFGMTTAEAIGYLFHRKNTMGVKKNA